MANTTKPEQLTLLDLKNEHFDAFWCVMSHTDEHDRRFLSKTARGFRDLFVLRPDRGFDRIVQGVEDEDVGAATTSTGTTRGNDDDVEKTSAGNVVQARGIIRSAAMARWFLDQGCGEENGYHMMTAAVENGSVESLEELLRPSSRKDIVCNFNDDCRDWSLSRYAAEHGQLEVLQWLFGNGHKWCGYTWAAVSRAAARGGHMDILQWLHRAGCPMLQPASASTASDSTPLPYYKRKAMVGGGAPGGGGGGDIVSEAARWGRLDALRFLRGIGVSWPSTGCRTAILSRDHEVVKWMVAEGCPLGDVFPCSPIVSFIASVPGTLDLLRWLKDERGMGEPGGGLFRAAPEGADKADALRVAAYHGNFPVMRWLRMEAGAEWSEETTAAAADGGSLECLSWLHINECPWDEETVVSAAAGGHMDVLRYTHGEGLRAPSGKACAAAAQGGHMEVLHWLVRNGYLADEAATETLGEWLAKRGNGGMGGMGEMPPTAGMAA